MDLLDLRLALAVAERGSITRGAADVHLTLASASARVRALERHVGAALFERGRRGVTPTAVGVVLLRHAREVRSAIDRMEADLAEVVEGRAATVRLWANTSATLDLGEVLTDFLSVAPHARIDLEEHPSQDVVDAVSTGRAELGVVADSVDLSALRTDVLRSDDLVVLVPTSHPVARATSLGYAEVLRWPNVGLSPARSFQEYLEGRAGRLGTRPTYRVRLPTVASVVGAVASGVGLAVLPASIVPPEVIEAVSAQVRPVVVPLEDAWAHRSLMLCSAPGFALSESAQALRRHVLGAYSDDAPGPPASG